MLTASSALQHMLTIQYILLQFADLTKDSVANFYDDSIRISSHVLSVFAVESELQLSLILGTTRGQADGFALDILAKLKDVKSKVSETLLSEARTYI